jgi:hypothetical protein
MYLSRTLSIRPASVSLSVSFIRAIRRPRTHLSQLLLRVYAIRVRIDGPAFFHIVPTFYKAMPSLRQTKPHNFPGQITHKLRSHSFILQQCLRIIIHHSMSILAVSGFLSFILKLSMIHSKSPDSPYPSRYPLSTRKRGTDNQ